MISVNQILAHYPPNLQMFRESILKEYLQYKILNSIYNSSYSDKMAFSGGTALRIIYGNSRFSEDLDFDNFDLTEEEFENIGEVIKKDLELEGLQIELGIVTRNAYRLKIRIPRLLFDSGLSQLREQKILIQVDTEPQKFDYELNKPFLNKFEVFTQINAVPKDLLLAQKIYTAFKRKRIMGRDFYDVVFLYGIGAKPNLAYLGEKLNVNNEFELKQYLLKKTKDVDFNQLAKDVEPLLFDPRDKKKVILFREFLEQIC